jgi:paraquat-inducible protein A
MSVLTDTLGWRGGFAGADAQLTSPRLRECPGCGQFQTVPALLPGSSARCFRCRAVLRRTREDSLARALALNFAALSMFGVACLMSLMTVSTVGIVHSANLFTGPSGLRRGGLWELAVVVLFTTVAAPFVKLIATTYVLAGLRMSRPPRHLRTVFAWVERLNPWSMTEVYLLGVFVAYTKLIDLVHIEIGPALYALGALMLTMVATDAVLDRQAVWEEMERRGIPGAGPVPALTRHVEGALSCHSCGLVSVPAVWHPACPRCGTHLHARRPHSIARTWALVIAAAILYVPANVYPVLTVIQMGSGAPSTILGGVEELYSSGMYPLAALVFLASIMVPILKVAGLVFMLVTTQIGWPHRLRDRTVIYRIVTAVGRWSMIDIFMASILVALVQFGAVVTIESDFGAVSFAAVVILTMFAAESFDPRLMWDAAAARRAQA